MYSKRADTSRILGALYETKLLSLLYFRAIHDDDIEEFQLRSNDDQVGAFGDICFKAKAKDKPITVFIQVRRRRNKKQTLKIDLETYFNNYMKIRQLFHPSNKDLFFRGKFDETESLFVVYTNAQVDLTEGLITSDVSDKLNDMIGTGGTVYQPYKYEHNVEYLTKIAVKDQVISLAERIAKFITGIENFQMMLTDEYVLRYHVILGRQVFDISEIQPNEYRIASFCNDFFDTNEEYLILFKDTLFKEILKKRTIKPVDINKLLSEYLAEPTDATRLSKLIGPVITYKNGQLEFDKQSTKDFRPDMKPMDVSRSTVNKAVELAAREILSFQKFKVPAAFGNKDLTISGSDAKIWRRINYLTLRIINLKDNCKSSKIITIDEHLEDGFLRLNGGIAGAIGNIFVLDDSTKLMKITDNWESLGTLAKKLYSKLNSEIYNLHDYKFCFKVVKFPKLSFDCSEYEENLSRDFLNKLQFYCYQADDDGVEEILKGEIADYQLNQPNFPVKTDAIFLRYHDAIQKWWVLPQQTSLTRESDLFRRSINNIIKDPLMSLLNCRYMKQLQQYNDYTFTKDAVRSLNLQDQHSSTIIISENSVLTVVKVMQHLKNNKHIVLDLEYIADLPTNDAICSELAYTNVERVLILVCDKIDSRIEMKDISEAVKYRRTIIITNQTSLQIINRCFPKADAILHDKKLSLIDMSKNTQKSIFETATAILPGVEIRLDLLLKGWPKTGPRPVHTAVPESAVADKKTGTGSYRIGDEEWNVPGTSEDLWLGLLPD